MTRIVLHRAIGSPPARAVMMLGDMLGLNMEIKDVNIILLEHKTPEFKKLNPMGTVPVLQDGDFVISESHAIMKYLLHKYGEDKHGKLYPSDITSRALVDQCMFFNAGVFFPTLTAVGRSTFIKGQSGPSNQQLKDIDASYSIIDAYLEHRRYLATDQLTLADLAAGSTATAIQVMRKVDAGKYPRYADWLARLEDEPVFKKVNAPGVAFFHKLMTKFWENNKNKEQTI